MLPHNRPSLHATDPSSFTRSTRADRTLANALPQIIWTCDAEGRLEWVNDRWFEVTGLTEQQTLENKGALVVMHRDDRNHVARSWADALATSTPAEIEYRLWNVRGEYRWHLARIAPVRGADGKIAQWVAVAFDIHDRRLAEDALRASERRFETFFTRSPQAMAITRQSDGAFVNVNAAFTELTGFTHQELVGKTGVELGMIGLEERAALIEVLNAAPERTAEVSIRRKDGQLLKLATWHAHIDIDGVPCFVSGSMDLTRRRGMEDALRQSEAEARARADELAALMDAVPAAVLITHDPESREVSGNRMAHEAFRIPLGRNMSQPAGDATATQQVTIVADGEELPLDRLPLARAARGEELRDFEGELRFDDGQTHLYGNTVPLRDENGTPRGAIAAFVDVTRLKQAEEALRRAARRKDEFLALLSHELRNPLTPILTAARLLEPRVDAESRHDLDVIVRQVNHVVRLVDDLLDVSRVARGAVTLSRTRIEPAIFAAHAVEATAPLFEERGHRLEIMVPEDGLAVEGDEVRLTQIVDNLLSNAARYTPPGGSVRLTAARDGDQIVISVRDTGIGFDPTLLPDLFEVFVQGPRGSDRADGGLGIGLSLVKALTELHGGSITAHSDGPGWGSLFTVRLPAAPLPSPSPPADEGTPSADETETSSLRVLIVDDHRDIVDGLSRLLAAAGYDVRAALNPADAIALAESFRPRVAILDIGLPVMDGYALGAALRERLGDETPGLIALSGYNQPDDRQRSEAAGFMLHLAKPIDVDQLTDALANLDSNRSRASHG